ncbi:Fatty acid desaturase [Cesiribacter andamanensis AMV16]|uniref:Fatty acid desaturase n=1 Tax=Cesiribacter andamanensis AMV16 TaxID=1279009 RepID=M7NQ80_9BACT|nr:Fatty acid desaturase [Cesiribacter andamanensis AMV16]
MPAARCHVCMWAFCPRLTVVSLKHVCYVIIIFIFIAHWYLSLFCQTFFLHRYAAHKMYTMSPFWERFFYFATWATQGSSYLSPRAYAILHRMHHAYSDTPKDPHSPHHTKNLFTMMWETKDIYNEVYTHQVEVEERFRKDVPDWPAFDQMADTRWSRIGWGLFYVALYVLFINVLEMPGTHWWMYGLLPIHFLMGPVHGAIVNWSGHKYGYANFDNHDKSRNSLIIDFLMLGELFQNNHHKLPNRANFGVRWFEFDPIYPAVRLLSVMGVIKMRPKRVSISPQATTNAEAA